MDKSILWNSACLGLQSHLLSKSLIVLYYLGKMWRPIPLDLENEIKWQLKLHIQRLAFWLSEGLWKIYVQMKIDDSKVRYFFNYVGYNWLLFLLLISCLARCSLLHGINGVLHFWKCLPIGKWDKMNSFNVKYFWHLKRNNQLNEIFVKSKVPCNLTVVGGKTTSFQIPFQVFERIGELFQFILFNLINIST